MFQKLYVIVAMVYTEWKRRKQKGCTRQVHHKRNKRKEKETNKERTPTPTVPTSHNTTTKTIYQMVPTRLSLHRQEYKKKINKRV